MKPGKEKRKLSLFETNIPCISHGYLSVDLQVCRKSRRHTLSPLQWLPLGRREEMGRQWVANRDLSFICNVLVFKNGERIHVLLASLNFNLKTFPIHSQPIMPAPCVWQHLHVCAQGERTFTLCVRLNEVQ